MSVWFEGNSEIECTLQQVKQALENHGEHYVGIISLMPGLTSVELVEQGSDFVTIKTNEGLMKRRNISKHLETKRVIVEFDEEGRMLDGHLWCRCQSASQRGLRLFPPSAPQTGRVEPCLWLSPAAGGAGAGSREPLSHE